MNWAHNRQSLRIASVLVPALTLASFLANSVQLEQDKELVAAMTGKLKTVCVGRFLIDLPAEATVRLRRGFISGYDVSSTDRETDAEFAERLEQLESDLHAAKDAEGRIALQSIKPLAAGTGQGKVFVHDRHWAQGFEGARIIDFESIDLQGMLRLPQVSIEARAKGMALDSGDELVRLLGRFRATHSEDIPSEPGFCIGHAIVRDPYEHPENESIIMFAGLPGHPDVSIVLSSMAGLDPAPRLLERHAIAVGKRHIFVRLAFSHVPEEARTVNGLDGDELVMRVREPNFTTGYSFQWEMPGRPDDLNAPLLMLEMDSGINPQSGGKPVQSTLTEEAMIDLWDRIVGSIRLRPTLPPERAADAMTCSAACANPGAPGVPGARQAPRHPAT